MHIYNFLKKKKKILILCIFRLFIVEIYLSSSIEYLNSAVDLELFFFFFGGGGKVFLQQFNKNKTCFHSIFIIKISLVL